MRLELEICGKCNLTCVMCTQYFGYDGRVMNLDEIKNILTLNGAFEPSRISSITLHGAGEPLLHPHFDKVISLIPEHISISFLTNGTLLSKWANVIASSNNISSINVSMDAISPEIYSLIRGGKVEKTIEGLLSLKEALSKYGKKLDITINMTLMRINNGDVRSMIDFCSVHGFKLAIWPLITDQAHSKDWVAKRPGWVFKYVENILSKEELYVIYHEMKAYSRELNVDLIVDDFMTHDSKEGRGVQFCNVFDYNRLFFSDGSAKHCCLQTKPIFSWRESSEICFDTNQTHLNVLKMKNENQIPDECKGSGCPFVGTGSKSDEADIEIGDGGFRGQKVTFKRKKLEK